MTLTTLKTPAQSKALSEILAIICEIYGPLTVVNAILTDPRAPMLPADPSFTDNSGVAQRQGK